MGDKGLQPEHIDEPYSDAVGDTVVSCLHQPPMMAPVMVRCSQNGYDIYDIMSDR
jgi:hypothetical protein